MNNKKLTSYYIGSTCGRGVKNLNERETKKLSYDELKYIYENNQYDDEYEYVILILMHDKIKALMKSITLKINSINRQHKSKTKSMMKRQATRMKTLEQLNNEKTKIYNILVKTGMFVDIRNTEEYKTAVKEYKRTNKVCELTGKSDRLVLHHKASVNSNPELACDKNNFVVVTDEIHKSFHKQYGYGNNTLEQWNEFVGKF